MEEWKEYKICEITIMKNGRKRPLEKGTYPVYGGNGIMDYTNDYNAENNIIVGRVGAYCGNVFLNKHKCWVSDNAIYIIEVKAHELSRKDRVGIVGAKYKFKASITEACSQCSRASKYIGTADSPQFGNKEGFVKIDKAKPVYKIVVTFQHYYSLLGQMDKLVESGLMETEYRDTWIVSLFDLMVVSDFVETEGEFLSYLDMHKIINTNHSTFHDELDVFGQFLNNDLLRKVRHNKPARIIGGSEDIDAEYSRDYLWPIEINDLDEYMRK